MEMYTFKSWIAPQKIEDIKFFVGNKNYSICYFTNGSFKKISYHLLKCQSLFADNQLFIRVHRSYIVNKTMIEHVDLKAGFLKINTKEPIPIDKKYLKIWS